VKRGSTFFLAGWLLADSMLGLMLLGLAADSGAAAPAAAAPSPTASASPSASPSIATASPTGVEVSPVVKEMAAGPGQSDAEIAAQVRRQFAALAATGRRAAFVLTFGSAPSPGPGVALAKRVNAALGTARGDVFTGAGRRDFWQATDADAPTGTVRVEVYLFRN
jgi:hypothetical protein